MRPARGERSPLRCQHSNRWSALERGEAFQLRRKPIQWFKFGDLPCAGFSFFNSSAPASSASRIRRQCFLVCFFLRSHKWVWNSLILPDVSRLSNVKILITLAHGEGCVRPEELVAEDLGEEDVVGLVLGVWKRSQQMAA